jgi:integrase
LHSDGNDAYLFQPLTNYRTLEFDKPLSTRMVWNIVARWGDYCGIGKLSPHDLRRTAITRALDQGLYYRHSCLFNPFEREGGTVTLLILVRDRILRPLP